MKLWLKVVVSVGLLTALFLLLPWHQVRDALLRLCSNRLGGCVARLCAWAHARRREVAHVRERRPLADLGFADAALCYGAGLFANLCLPSIVGGDVLRAALASRFTRRPEAAFLGGVLDRVTDMIAMTILVAAGGLLSHDALPGVGGNLDHGFPDPGQRGAVDLPAAHAAAPAQSLAAPSAQANRSCPGCAAPSRAESP